MKRFAFYLLSLLGVFLIFSCQYDTGVPVKLITEQVSGKNEEVQKKDSEEAETVQEEPSVNESFEGETEEDKESDKEEKNPVTDSESSVGELEKETEKESPETKDPVNETPEEKGSDSDKSEEKVPEEDIPEEKEPEKVPPAEKVPEENNPEIKAPEENEDIKTVPAERKWTFMVYMACDNGLESYGISDLNEMEAGISKDESISVVAFVDRHPGYDRSNGNWTDSRIYEISADENGKNKTLVSERKASSELDLFLKSETELNSGSAETLENYIKYCKREYPAENYVLVLWGLGSGWKGMCYDGTSDSIFSLKELEKTLSSMEDLRCLILDTSLGFSLETLYGFHNSDFMIAGFPGISSGEGFDYEKFFRRFYESDRSVNALKKAVINNSGTEIKMMEASKAAEGFKLLNDFGKSLAEYISSREIQKNLMETFFTEFDLYKSSSFPCDSYIDILEMTEYFLNSPDKNVAEKACCLREFISESIQGSGVSSVSVHLIPYISDTVPDQVHSDFYVSNDKKENLKCSFVNDSRYWCPTGKNVSFLDALFYRTF